LLPPVALAAVAPHSVAWSGGLASYLVLLPAFLLPYAHGWRGAVAALGLGELVLFTSAVIMARQNVGPGPLVSVSLVLVLVSIGTGRMTLLLHRSRTEAEQRSLSDPGTGLPNRRHAVLHLERAFAAAARGERLTVVSFDLDSFKQVNDRHGHAVGDEVLATFARILADRTRRMNLSARVGGEEFLSILENAGPEGAVTFAEDVRMAMQAAPLPCGSVTVSAGIASFEDGMGSPDALLSAAETALYEAKTRGRNQVAVVGYRRARRESEIEHHPQRYGEGERLLLVDDNGEARRSLGTTLRNSGFEIIEALSGDQAIGTVRRLGSPPDLVITDLIMPSMTGFRLVEELRRTGPPIRALYLTNDLFEQGVWSEPTGGTYRYLRHPVSAGDVAAAARQLLDVSVADEDEPGFVHLG
jgi:diguanylate cyclase (GGDEF)-like protein